MAIKKEYDIPAIIEKAADRAAEKSLRAFYTAANRKKGNTYKETEKRLFAYTDLLDKIKDDKEKLKRLHTHGAPERSKSIMRHIRPGVRLSPEEVIESLSQNMKAAIAADEDEVSTIKRALQLIKDDDYYIAVEGRYIKGLPDEEIAASFPCDPSTIRRHRGRLVRKIEVRLYGAQALR